MQSAVDRRRSRRPFVQERVLLKVGRPRVRTGIVLRATSSCKRRHARRRTAFLTIALIVFFAFPARATMTKDQCVDANTEGQNLRLDGRFVLARERFGACSIPSCPVMIREDCTRRLRELDGAQPTIVFDVVGAVPSSVQVTVDG